MNLGRWSGTTRTSIVLRESSVGKLSVAVHIMTGRLVLVAVSSNKTVNSVDIPKGEPMAVDRMRDTIVPLSIVFTVRPRISYPPWMITFFVGNLQYMVLSL